MYNSKKIGGISDITCWSFYPGKNLGAFGDGGALTTNDFILSEKIRCLCNYGSTSKYTYVEKGINSRLDPIQASVLNTKLKHLDAWNRRRNEIANLYEKYLDPVISLQKPMIAQIDNYNSWHLYVISCSHRDELQTFLSEHNIQTLIHYPIPPFEQKAYIEYRNINMPTASRICNMVLSLPICPFMQDSQVERVINAVNRFQIK